VADENSQDDPSFVVMDVEDVVVLLPDQFPLVHLQEREAPFRDLKFRCGMTEGAAIASALGRVASQRPLTHELSVSILEHLHADVASVRLTGRRDGTYFAELVIMGRDGKIVLQARPSDALALALRQGVRAPVLCDERLLDDEGDVTPFS
jgi:bifunctional DNase/RNase